MQVKDLLGKNRNKNRAEELYKYRCKSVIQEWEILQIECERLKRCKKWHLFKRFKLKKIIRKRLVMIKILLHEKKNLEKH